MTQAEVEGIFKPVIEVRSNPPLCPTSPVLKVALGGDQISAGTNQSYEQRRLSRTTRRGVWAECISS